MKQFTLDQFKNLIKNNEWKHDYNWNVFQQQDENGETGITEVTCDIYSSLGDIKIYVEYNFSFPSDIKSWSYRDIKTGEVFNGPDFIGFEVVDEDEVEIDPVDIRKIYRYRLRRVFYRLLYKISSKKC